jgi:hypothetical protein
MHVQIALLCGAAVILSCSSPPGNGRADTQTTNVEARAFYQAYEGALKAHRRDTLAAFYRPEGAVIVLNGATMTLTNAGIDSIYRGGWQGPRFFAFDSLRFESINANQVLVTGGFRWLPAESADTAQFVYLSILEQTPVGPRIRLEHETQRRERKP